MINPERIKPEMHVLGSNDGQLAIVDHMDGVESIKLKKDSHGKHHYIPISWVKTVDNKVHLDRSSEQAMKEWRSEA